MYMRVSDVPVVAQLSKRSREFFTMSFEARIEESYYQRGLLDGFKNRRRDEGLKLPSDIPTRYAAIYRSGYQEAK